MNNIINSFSLPILSLALSFNLSSRSDFLNLLINSLQSIFPSLLVSIFSIILSISLLFSPRFNFLIAFLNSTWEIQPLPSESNSANIYSKLLLDVLTICLSFSNMSVSHWEFEEVWDTIVVLAPGGAVFTFLTLECPVYFMLSKFTLNKYLSINSWFPLVI